MESNVENIDLSIKRQISSNSPITFEILKKYSELKYADGSQPMVGDTMYMAHEVKDGSYILGVYNASEIYKFKELDFPKDFKPQIKFPIIEKVGKVKRLLNKYFYFLL
jgi:hypothetical protein